MHPLSLLLTILAPLFLNAQTTILRPAFVFDGEKMREGWYVQVEGNKIIAAGPFKDATFPEGAVSIELPGQTLLPGLIEGHSHLFLHPYNETSWDDQVLRESHAERTARAVVHAQKTLLAGFTTVRDLGTEGAGYDDLGLKAAIEKGVIPGPRIIAAGPAIVAGGSYGPKGFASHISTPVGADVADGVDELIRLVRKQIGQGVDIIKVYADYRWGLRGEAMPTFSLEELDAIVTTARSSGRDVVAHASTEEGMRRAILAGVTTIEHGDGATPEILQLMAEKGVALCPTLGAVEAISQYRGWKKGEEPAPARVLQKKETFKQALAAGVTICMGGDVGVFSHGNNAWELELMVEYGMPPLDALRSATSVNARVFGWADHLGAIKPGLVADLIAVEGRPDQDIKALQQVKWVMKDGKVVK